MFGKNSGFVLCIFSFSACKMRKDVLSFVGSLERITGFAGAILSMIADAFPTPHGDLDSGNALAT